MPRCCILLALTLFVAASSAQTGTIDLPATTTDHFMSELVKGAMSLLEAFSAFPTVTLPAMVEVDGSLYRIPDIVFPTAAPVSLTSILNIGGQPSSSTISASSDPTSTRTSNPFSSSSTSSEMGTSRTVASVTPSSSSINTTTSSTYSTFTTSSSASSSSMLTSSTSAFTTQASASNSSPSVAASMLASIQQAASTNQAKKNRTIIALSVVFGIAALCLIALLVFLFWYRKRRSRSGWQEQRDQPSDDETHAWQESQMVHAGTEKSLPVAQSRFSPLLVPTLPVVAEEMQPGETDNGALSHRQPFAEAEAAALIRPATRRGSRGSERRRVSWANGVHGSPPLESFEDSRQDEPPRTPTRPPTSPYPSSVTRKPIPPRLITDRAALARSSYSNPAHEQRSPISPLSGRSPGGWQEGRGDWSPVHERNLGRRIDGGVESSNFPGARDERGPRLEWDYTPVSPISRTNSRGSYRGWW